MFVGICEYACEIGQCLWKGWLSRFLRARVRMGGSVVFGSMCGCVKRKVSCNSMEIMLWKWDKEGERVIERWERNR